jgi:serine/threonine protein kinase
MAVESKLARYRPIATLGSGGMASVVLAEDMMLGRRVALKRMHPSAADSRGLLRLRREALVGASLSHRNLVSIYDVIDSEDGDVVIVMEYVEGETLRDALSREGRLAPPEALRVLTGVAAALDAIHARGIVHRDVKPANVLLGLDRGVKLADLGIASVPDQTRITTAGTLLGSFRYMAPEQLAEGPATAAIDVYALAAVAFEALSGKQARREPHPLAVAHAISTRPPPDLRQMWPEAPSEAAEVLMCGMCRDATGRPASAGELVTQLKAALERGRSLPVRRPSSARPRAEVLDAAMVDETKTRPPRPIRAAAAQRPSSPHRSISSRSRSVAAAPRRARGGGSVGGAATPVESAAVPKEAPAGHQRLPWGRILAAVALALVAGGLAFVVLSGGGASPTSQPAGSRTRDTTIRSGGRPGGRAAAGRAGGRTAARGNPTSGSPRSSTSRARSAPPTAATTPSGATPSAPAGTTTTRPSAAGSGPASDTPVGAVKRFYALAAAHQYSQAWMLADLTFRSQLGGYESFQAGQAADRSIAFHAARIIRQTSDIATIYVATTSVRASGTEECTGTVDVSNAGRSAGWRVHMIHINCT